VTPNWIPEYSTSHNKLLESTFRPMRDVRFDAIVVPTNRPVRFLRDCLELASRTHIRLIVACSKRVTKHEVIEAAARWNAEVYAVDLPPQQVSPFKGISFDTSTDKDLLALTSGLTRDLSAKRNLGLVLARTCGWERIMFLDDDIQQVSERDVAALAAALDDHDVSVLIPDEFPDNSVVCHANRLGGGEQGKFASAGGMGVRCNRDGLSFFPNIYNEDWFFFSSEAANRKIAEVGRSRQMAYNPYANPERAVKEEFGDLLAEGLYARFDHGLRLSDVDDAFWDEFLKTREDFLDKVVRQLAARLNAGNLTGGEEDEFRAAQVSVSAARHQLAQVDRDLCQRFIRLWWSDLARWREYITGDELPRLDPDSAGHALSHLGLAYLFSPSSR
jgi:glycosyltransferase involved in cell wall biosynthesis